jgi:hypothetical protein
LGRAESGESVPERATVPEKVLMKAPVSAASAVVLPATLLRERLRVPVARLC